MQSTSESRQEKRYAFSSPIAIYWTDAKGEEHQASGTSINVSLYGTLAEVPEAIPSRTQVRVQFQGKEISSKAHVRHCQQAQSWFRVGLEFERTLLAEHISFLDEVLIQSLRSANKDGKAEEAGAPGTERPVAATLGQSNPRVKGWLAAVAAKYHVAMSGGSR